ncbi:MAG: NUDIX hydrolase [Anaerolineae bacterium]|jgi:ADP-ribose pyrophosphatase YjhB (NUDIX family)|nr:NUDIX hydrolase [Anaerolineae bacterium]
MKITNKNDRIRFKFRVAALAMYQGHVLIHKYEGSKYWSLPGGNVELGETTQEALKRELQEEANLEVEVDRLLWVHENYFVRKSGRHAGKYIHEICFYYLVRINTEKTFQFTGKEDDLELFFKWVLLDDISAYSLEPAFLKSRLNLISGHPEHIVTIEERPETILGD